MIGCGPGAAYATCCSVAFQKLASELFFERAFYRGPLNFPLVNYLPVAPAGLVNRNDSDDTLFDDDLGSTHRVTSRLRNTVSLMILYGSPAGGTISRS
jgi:hypothetical protein